MRKSSVTLTWHFNRSAIPLIGIWPYKTKSETIFVEENKLFQCVEYCWLHIRAVKLEFYNQSLIVNMLSGCSTKGELEIPKDNGIIRIPNLWPIVWSSANDFHLPCNQFDSSDGWTVLKCPSDYLNSRVMIVSLFCFSTNFWNLRSNTKEVVIMISPH